MKKIIILFLILAISLAGNDENPQDLCSKFDSNIANYSAQYAACSYVLT